MDELMAFAYLLLKVRGKRTRTDLAKRLGVSQSALANWEGCNPCITLPKKESLPKICEVYGIPFSLAERIWNETKREIDSRRRVTLGLGKNRKYDRSLPNFTGEIGSKASIIRTNSQLSGRRYGRS